MAQVMPAEIINSSQLQPLPPRFGGDVGNGVTQVREDVATVLAYLFVQDSQRHLVKGYGVRSAVLMLIRSDPCVPKLQVNLLPFQRADVPLTEARRYREKCHVREVRRKVR